MKKERDAYLKLGLTIFCAFAGVIAVYFLLLRFEVVGGFIGTIVNALQPVMIGIVLAYILTPVAKGIESVVRKLPGVSKVARLISAIATIIIAFVVLGFFCAMLLPQLIDSVAGLVSDLPEMLQTQLGRLEGYLQHNDEAANAVMQMITSAETYVTEWIKTNMLSTITSMAGQVLSIGSTVVSLVVAIIVTIYLLLDRERYVAQLRKLFLSVCRSDSFSDVVLETAHQANLIFSGFIRGKLVDSFIVGVICFAVLSLLKMPYTLVISVIVGVTNIIPMFGPFIGAIPSAFLLLLVDPMKCVTFLIFIIILQQIDGNILGPAILGDSTGLSALYVTIAMLIFSKLMGFLGMLVGVPLFAVLYYIVKRAAEYSLTKRDLPADTMEYKDGKPEPKKD